VLAAANGHKPFSHQPMPPCDRSATMLRYIDEEHLRHEIARPHCASNIALAAAGRTARSVIAGQPVLLG